MNTSMKKTFNLKDHEYEDTKRKERKKEQEKRNARKNKRDNWQGIGEQ